MNADAIVAGGAVNADAIVAGGVVNVDGGIVIPPVGGWGILWICFIAGTENVGPEAGAEKVLPVTRPGKVCDGISIPSSNIYMRPLNITRIGFISGRAPERRMNEHIDIGLHIHMMYRECIRRVSGSGDSNLVMVKSGNGDACQRKTKQRSGDHDNSRTAYRGIRDTRIAMISV